MLKEWQYFKLQAQYDETPDPRESFGASGQHYILHALLRDFGYRPKDRIDAYDMAGKLLSEDYEHDTHFQD